MFYAIDLNLLVPVEFYMNAAKCPPFAVEKLGSKGVQVRFLPFANPGPTSQYPAVYLPTAFRCWHDPTGSSPTNSASVKSSVAKSQSKFAGEFGKLTSVPNHGGSAHLFK